MNPTNFNDCEFASTRNTERREIKVIHDDEEEEDDLSNMTARELKDACLLTICLEVVTNLS